ncbi:DUF6538 domain-containing protein [Halochromatium sp.]
MPSTLYLRRNRSGIYYYRRRLPSAVRAAFDGRREIVRSLATTRRRDAIPLAQAPDLDIEQQIRKALAHSMPEKSSFYYLLHPEEFSKDIGQLLADIQDNEVGRLTQKPNANGRPYSGSCPIASTSPERTVARTSV